MRFYQFWQILFFPKNWVAKRFLSDISESIKQSDYVVFPLLLHDVDDDFRMA
ncbi:hypothetical protein DFR36_102138 [Melaminivora alkalimesophila]|uniref:Uncharacterized protein n=1 Tax=Melaminivora alkalimesophila TaxID=1165852 RepID=A0A317RHX5_9BURK|nr:hypothetical protein DFR36_102138 [Melaminivora alkalimesophila]